MSGYSDNHDALLITLELAVPLRMWELAGMSKRRREATCARWAQESASEVGSGGDSIMFRTPTKERRHGSCVCGGSISKDRDGWHHIGDSGREDHCLSGQTPALADAPLTGTAPAFNALARGLAAAAWHPSGVTFLGQHWCVGHCTGRQEAA